MTPQTSPSCRPRFRWPGSCRSLSCRRTESAGSLTRLEIGKHGKYAAIVVLCLRQVELGEDAAHVFLDGAFGDPKTGADTCVRPPLRHQRQDLALARCEHVERVLDASRRDKFLHQCRIDDGAAVHDAFDGLEEVVDPADAALE